MQVAHPAKAPLQLLKAPIRAENAELRQAIRQQKVRLKVAGQVHKRRIIVPYKIDVAQQAVGNRVQQQAGHCALIFQKARAQPRGVTV